MLPRLAVLVALASAACYLPPDPVEPAPDSRGPARAPAASDAPTAPADSLVDGAWRPAASAEHPLASTSLTPRVASALSAGTWSAEVEPPGWERLPDVSLRLRDLVLPGAAAGAAEYRFEGYRCRYALYVERVEGNAVHLRQRLEEGRCAGPGRIILAWGDGESLVGEWLRPDGTPWFRALLSRTEDVSAVPDAGSGGAPPWPRRGQGAEGVP